MRINSVDAFRGIAILSMIFWHFINWFSKDVPLYLKYDVIKQVTVGDLIAPLFLIVVGISLWLSYSKRIEKNQPFSEIRKAYFKRYFSLILIGLLLDMLRRMKIDFTWGVLETIGATVLIAFLLINYSDRILIGFIAFTSILYSYLSFLPEFSSLVYSSPFGGIPAILSWLSFTLIGVLIGRHLLKLFNEKKKFLFLLLKSSAFLIVAGILLSFVIPLDRGLISTSFVLLASGGCLLIFAVLFYLIEQKKMKLQFLIDFGLMALILFIAQYIFVGIPIKFLSLYKALPLSTGIIVAVVLTVIFYFFVRILKHYNFRLSF